MIQSVPSPGCSDQNNRRLVRGNGKQTLIYSKIAGFRNENTANHGSAACDFRLFVVDVDEVQPGWRSRVARFRPSHRG